MQTRETRWFFDREEGNEIANSLRMFATISDELPRHDVYTIQSDTHTTHVVRNDIEYLEKTHHKERAITIPDVGEGYLYSCTKSETVL